MLARIAKRVDSDQTASSERICAVCLGLCDGQLVFKSLEHLLYLLPEYCTIESL